MSAFTPVFELAKSSVKASFFALICPATNDLNKGHQNLPFEGKMRATDGGCVSVLVNMDENDRLLAVEFVYWESSSGVPLDWPTLKVVSEPPMGVSNW